MRLLTAAAANAKTAKNASKGNYLSYILHLAPYNLSGKNLCPMASKGCAAACLNSAGRGRFDSVQQGRLRKAKLFLDARDEFLRRLVKDLEAVRRKAKRERAVPVVRLNGTSDLNWRAFKTDNGQNVFERFPDIQFYDYTAVPRYLELQVERPLPNYHLTFSRKEDNEAAVERALALGFNVAAVFSGRELPAVYNGRPVLNGDAHDLRFLDGNRGAYIGLLTKGKAKADSTGFVIRA